MQIQEEDLIHYGILRRSGRYPWGSGGDPDNVRNKGFLDYVKELENQGLTQKQIAEGIGIEIGDKVSITDLRAAKSVATNELKQYNRTHARNLRDKGWSPTAIGRDMNVSESTVRGWLKAGDEYREDVLKNTADALRKEVDAKGMVDVGKGNEHYLGVTRTRFDTALSVLKEEGYGVHNVPQPQITTGHDTTRKVLVQPGVTQKDAFLNRSNIEALQTFSDDGGKTFGFLHPPLEVDPKRLSVVTKEDGGDKSDGMIYVRPGVKDIELGGKNYAQVRVAVGPDHYLKGMAIYSNDLPDGVDLEFHTSKNRTDNKLDALKKNIDDPAYTVTGEHPLLKSTKRQILADAGTPKERVTSAMNIVNEEGDWTKWSRNLSSQMLSKQNPALAKSQLAMTYERRQNEFDTISKLTNPTVRKKLLEDFAGSTDSAAVQLKAAALPKVGNHVILPLNTIKPTQIYAPNFDNGDVVALIRHPHAGTFEIPRLIVNNRNREAKALMGDASDAVGIHHSVAQWLSGADFDGDSVLVIRDNNQKIKASHPLDQLKNFDPRTEYPPYEGMKPMRNTQKEMGEISNLITDMSLKEASHEELARAVKHSMVVIDAEKHGLDYRRSYAKNGIKTLKQKYQTGGASTLISRAGADKRVPEVELRKARDGGKIDLKTGELVYVPTGRVRSDNGKPRQSKFQALALTNDARTLMSSPIGTPMERYYADHSNKLKALANRARLDSHNTPRPKKSSSAAKAYKPEVDSLLHKLKTAEMNAPLERRAQAIGHTIAKARIDANPLLSEDAKKKIRYQALSQARINTGARKERIEITAKEWEAIQARAISDSKLVEILKNANMDTVREHATPKTERLMTTAKTANARAMLAAGFTRSEVANHLGVSLTTLDLATGGE